MPLWRVYMADGDPLATRTLTTLLGQEADIETAAFSSAAELRAAAQARPPDAVIAEVTLPGASGIDLIDAVSAADPDLVSLVVTSASDPDATGQALSRVGPLRLVHKPFKPHELLPRLLAGLERRSLARALAA